MSRARGQEGIALVSSIIILMIVLGLGFALMAFTDTQQQSATNQQSNESAFDLAEAALNAQIYQLSLQWPTSATGVTYPYGCNAASNGSAYCPSPGDLSTAYPVGSQSCPAGTQGDAWSSSAPSNGWTTYVRDAGATSSTQQLFTSSAEENAAAYDAVPNGYVWVRAVGIVNCQTAVVVSKVSAQYVALAFPHNVLTANGFETSNRGNGSGPIISTGGSMVDVRCTGLGNNVGPGSQCTNYVSGQVSPDTVTYSPNIPAQTITPEQLLSLKVQAISNGTYWGPNQCPTSIDQLTGAPTYISGPCNLSFSGNGTANSPSSPGFLVLVNGTIEFNGSTSFYGVIYAVNAQNCPPGCLGSGSDVVYIHGNAQVTGGVTVDGNGTAQVGESHKGNLTYSSQAFNNLKGWGGAAGSPNTFRQLPMGQ